MTEKELADLFTPPNGDMAAMRRVYITRVEDRIRQMNLMPTTAANTEYRNGLAYALLIFRDLVDSSGKVFKEDLAPAYEHCNRGLCQQTKLCACRCDCCTAAILQGKVSGK